jgi:tetratricopeptide (TPR) repeat protein
MKITSKLVAAALGFVGISSAVSAQSLDDAKTAIGAEQYQKAKTMLTNLTVTQPTKDENYFYLGWVYLKENEPDSAKLWFNKGLAANNKSALNFVGLGAVALIDKDNATATSNFTQAMTISKKDNVPYVYIGKAYLLTTNGGDVPQANADAAIDALNKGKAINAKNPELSIALGDAYHAELKANEAYESYQDALTLDPKSAAADVALGVVSKYANNFDDAIAKFQAAIAIDPNYGPAYREWAETDVRWAADEPKVGADKVAEAVTEYKKYLSLTDMSIQSEMRYADFLIFAKDYTTLQQIATQLSKSANTNLRVYRYLGYADYENKDYTNGLTALNTWMTKADPKRIIPEDYLYLGRLQVATGQDSIGILTLQKAYSLDTTQAVVLGEIAKSLYTEKKYKQAGDEYALYISKYPRYGFSDLFGEGRAYYFAYDPKTNPDTTLLTRADSAFSRIQQKAKSPVPTVALFRAYTNDMKEKDRNNIVGYAKPYYEQYVQIVAANTAPSATEKKNLVIAYDYLGAYYEFKEKDDAKASDNYNKALAIDPTNAQALDYNKKKGK